VANDNGKEFRILYKPSHSCGKYDHLIPNHCNAEITESECHSSCIKKLIYCQPIIPTAHNVPETIVSIKIILSLNELVHALLGEDLIGYSIDSFRRSPMSALSRFDQYSKLADLLIEKVTKEDIAECARLLALNVAHYQSQ
jgi:hypothetical protein